MSPIEKINSVEHANFIYLTVFEFFIFIIYEAVTKICKPPFMLYLHSNVVRGKSIETFKSTQKTISILADNNFVTYHTIIIPTPAAMSKWVSGFVSLLIWAFILNAEIKRSYSSVLLAIFMLYNTTSWT